MSRYTRSFGPRVVVGVVALTLVPAAGTPVAAAESAGAAPAQTSLSTSTAAGAAQRARQTVRVASFNVSGVLHDGKAPSHQPWNVRRKRVARQLLGQDPAGQRAARADVVALQEANTGKRVRGGRTQYTDLVHRMNTWNRAGNVYRAVNPRLNLNATRIAYNSRTLVLLKAGAFKWSAQETRADGARMMAWAKFRVRATGKRFFFASVHLETVSKAIRTKQWQQLVNVAPKLAGGLPIIVGGDFNATRNKKSNSAWGMLPRMKRAGFGDSLGQYGHGYLTYGQARPDHLVNARFNSANKYRRYMSHYKRSNWVGQHVDYIFASNRLKVTSWEMVADHAKGKYQLRGVIPSDHNLVRATIRLG